MLALALAGAGASAVHAGVTTINFNSDPAATGLYRELGNGASEWRASGGASGAANDGYLSGNDARGGQQWCLVFKDLEAGLVVQAFKFEADLRIGGGTARPADGFSINYVRSSDELLANADAGIDPTYSNFSEAGGEASLPEEGSRSGLGIGFDTWQSGDHPGGITDVVGISIRVDGALITQLPVPLMPGNTWPGGTFDDTPYRNLPASDSNYAKSMQTGALTTDEDLNGDGVVDAADVGVAQPNFADDPANWPKWIKNLKWEKFVAELTIDSKVKISWKGVELTPAGGLAVNYGPSSGRLVFAGRTGGAWEAHHVDNIVLTTVPSDKIVVGTANPSPIGFSLGVEDSGASVLDPSKVTLKLDGVAVDAGKLTTSKTGSTTTISFRDVGSPLAAGSTHSVTIDAKDTRGTAVSATRSFTVGDYTVLPASLAVTGVNTSQPGFTLSTYQVETGQDNTVYRADTELRGDLGPNIASPADGIEESVINYNQDAPAKSGNFNADNGFEDKPIPGIDAATNSDNIAMEILTYLQFDQPGVYTLIFNSDDGFRTSFAKNRREQLNNIIASQFDGGRGSTDTAVTLLVPTPGFYPVRSVWFEGGGGANLEWVVIRDGKTRALVNDGSANSIKAFRSASAAVPPGVVYASPGRNTGGSYGANLPIVLDIADGSAATVTQGSIVLKVNGAVVTPTISKSGSITTLKYTSATPFASSSTNTVSLAFNDSTGGSYTGSYTYNVASYSTIPVSMALPASAVDKSKTGFLFKTIQTDQGMETRVRRADMHSRGLYGLPNYADLTGVGGNGYFTITGSINMDQTQGNAGRFNGNNGFPEDPIPGIPGTLPNGNQSTDNISAEILTVIEFPSAGLYTFSFNSDDGFGTWFGSPDDGGRILAGQFDGGRGSSDTWYTVLIQQPGLYPVRSVWFEGGGGANLEWYTRKADGTYALLNDTANGGLKTYQYPLGKSSAYVKSFVPGDGANRVSLQDPIKAVIADGTGSVNPSSVTVKLNGDVVAATVTKSGSETTVSYTPSLIAGSKNTVELTFGDRTISRTFTAGDLPKAAFFIEAEDFNFDNGKSVAAASDMATYRGGAYAGKAAVAGVDYSRGNEPNSPYYRIGEDPQVPMDVNFAESWGRGFTDLQVNFKIGWIGADQWYNYTRTFPAGKYNVYAGLSHGDKGAGKLVGKLQQVTAGATTSNQTLKDLGDFNGEGTGGWGVNRLVPLQDATGGNVTLDLSGTTTLRYAANNGDFDFILFTPAVTEPPVITKVALNADGSLSIEWTGGGTLEAAPTISGPWTPIAGATSPYKFNPDPAVGQLFGRIRR
jgi:hypothetical protein